MPWREVVVDKLPDRESLLTRSGNSGCRQEEVNYPTLLAHGVAVRFVEGRAFAWTPVLAIAGRLVIAIHVQRPAIQAHVYGCATARRRLRRAEVLQADVLRRVVVCVG